MIVGYQEKFADSQISGWVRDQNLKDSDIFVDILCEGKIIAQSRANLHRADLERVGLGNGKNGFSTYIPKDMQGASLEVRVSDTDVLLPLAPEGKSSISSRLSSVKKSLVGKLHDVVDNLRSVEPSFDHLQAPYSGFVHSIEGGKIVVWCDFDSDEALPVILISGKPAWPSPHTTSNDTIYGKGYLHEFYISGIDEDASVALYAAGNETIYWLATSQGLTANLERSFFIQLERTLKTSLGADSIAAICSNANSETLARATKFIDSIKDERPACIVSFIDDATSLSMYPTIESQEHIILGIPWSDRNPYLRLLQEMGIKFSTVFLCDQSDRSGILADTLANDRTKRIAAFDTGPAGSKASLPVVALPDVDRDTGDHPPISEQIRSAESKFKGQITGPSYFGKPPEFAISSADTPTLLLVWKQHDAGLYGRRIDQVCRSYKSAFPDHRVVVLEIVYPHDERIYQHPKSGFSEFTYIREMNTLKQNGRFFNADGIEYRQIRVPEPAQMPRDLTGFLTSHSLLPTNTIVVFYPNVFNAERILDILLTYPLIVDVVDNQLAWSTGKGALEVLRQYFMVCKLADSILFNSAQNHNRFIEMGVIDDTAPNIQVIPNWYQLPKSFDIKASNSPIRRKKGGAHNIVYSGNMNERIDWDLIEAVSKLPLDINVHLIGEARSMGVAFEDLIQKENVLYHGPLSETQTLEILHQADLAILPHLADKVSKFMNPLKVLMYQAVGLRTVATNVEGLTLSKGLTIAETPDAFLDSVSSQLAAEETPITPVKGTPNGSEEFLKIISKLR